MAGRACVSQHLYMSYTTFHQLLYISLAQNFLEHCWNVGRYHNLNLIKHPHLLYIPYTASVQHLFWKFSILPSRMVA